MAHMEKAVGLGRKTGDNFLVASFRQVLVDGVFNEIAALLLCNLCLAYVCFFRHLVCFLFLTEFILF